ncbi:SRPBCC family protein [Streptomyces sp. R302]|uniref:SRPBCC family protein n=1 Tax=unclassified Streptomyces TaxID=2593676 RepID=UPI00145C4128|nr:SRPBCC family protein [Streptomyces sp. R301]NML81065.1 SRPBCC family protein [Streptomyces sp. R302]
MVYDTIEVEAPLRRVYDQWTQFEEFPRFMDGVEEVRQLDDRLCHWRTKVAGATREFDTEIVDQLPDERIAWRTVGGDVRQKGVVTFEQIDESHTLVRLKMEVEPSGLADRAAQAMGVVEQRIEGDLHRFKDFIEDRDKATGGWRGRLRPADSAGGTEGADTPTYGMPREDDSPAHGMPPAAPGGMPRRDGPPPYDGPVAP